MKRIVIISISLLLALILTACTTGVPFQKYNAMAARVEELESQLAAYEKEGKSGEQPISEPSLDSDIASEKPANQPSGAFDAKKVLTQLEKTEYIFKTDHYYFSAIVIKNSSPFDLEIQINATFYNDKGEIVGTRNDSDYAFESGYETAYVFSNDEEFATVQYYLQVNENNYYECVMSSLSYEVSTTKNKAIISVTNKGDKPAQFVKYIALFFKDDKVIYYGWGYCIDNENEIKPGATQRAEVNAYQKYDTVKVYLSGRA